MRAIRPSPVGLTAAVVALMCALGATPIQAGHIHPALEQRLLTAGPDEEISIVIRPIGWLEGAALKKQVATQYATRAGQHRAAVEALQTTARQTQPAILTALQSDDFRGRVSRPTGYWIDNVITAAATPSAIAEIASRADVDEVALLPQLQMVKPVHSSPDPEPLSAVEAQGAEPGLRVIKADSAWALGYTGRGRLVASIDNGVDGRHQLLSPKWRGHNGATWRESWFDPAYGDSVPRVYAGDGTEHGTQVMGIMVSVLPMGVVGDDEDTLGVCPDCQWISAAAISIPCPGSTDASCVVGDPYQAMQWIADPDGDPVTETDVPDAVANPWGTPEDPTYGCSNYFWNVIDNIEAAGAAMFFAAGNYDYTYPISQRVWNPANRITSDVNSFAVGMVNGNNSSLPIDAYSSRGPSGCDLATVKPEVVAPGVYIRSTVPNDGYNSDAYGTSFATPHVAGAAALLRQYRPNATTDQIKRALLESARDLGTTGDDNSYGRGIIDIAAALRWLQANVPSTQPSVEIFHDDYIRPAPGSSTAMTLTLRNTGTAATDVQVTMISGDDPRLILSDSTASFGSIGADGDSASNAADPLTFAVASDILTGERLPVRFLITADGGYRRTYYSAIQVGPEGSEDLFTHDAGNFRMTISAYGMFGMQADAMSPRRGRDGQYGVGYLYGDDATQTLFEGAFLIGTDADHVSDNIRYLTVPDNDFRVDPGGRIAVTEPGLNYAEETRAAFSDSAAENPLGLFIEQRTWVSDDPDADDYLTVEYTIYNRSEETINGLRAALMFDWDFPWEDASRDTSIWDSQNEVGWMQHPTEGRLRGVAVVSSQGACAYRTFSNYRDLFDGFYEDEKWAAMTSGFTQADADTSGDASHLIAAGPFNLDADSSVRVAFAIIGADSVAALRASVARARAKYNTGTIVTTPSSLEFTADENGSDPAAQTITLLNNTGGAVALYDVTKSPSWAAVDPDSGTIGIDGSLTLTVQPSISGVSAGTYSDTVILHMSFDRLPYIRVPATLHVIGQSTANVDPNPFAPGEGRTVRLRLKEAPDHEVTAKVYDLAGVPVKGLGKYAAGTESIEWDGLTSGRVTTADGVYLCRVEGQGFNQTFRIVIKKYRLTLPTR